MSSTHEDFIRGPFYGAFGGSKRLTALLEQEMGPLIWRGFRHREDVLSPWRQT